MKNISTTQKIFIYLLVLNLLFLGVYTFFFLHIKNLNQKSSIFAFEIEFFEERERTLADLERSLEEVSFRASMLENYFIPPDGIARFFEEIEELAFKVGVDFNLSVETVNLEDYDGLEIFKMVIDSRGEWDEVFDFVSFLELLPYQSNTSRLSFQMISPGSLEGLDREDFLPRRALWRSSMNFEVLKFK